MLLDHDWQDVTEDLLSLPKNMKLLGYVMDSSMTLQESMYAHEINDNKIDPKFDISQNSTISFRKQNKMIKLPNELKVQELVYIFTQIIKQQALVLCGYPLAQTIYTFAYLYDSTIYENHPILESLIQSIHTMGSCIYNLYKQSCAIIDNDVGLSSFVFHTKYFSHQQVIDKLIKSQKYVQAQIQLEINKNVKKYYQFLLLHLKLRKSFHLLTEVLGDHFKVERSNKIQQIIKSTSKNLIALNNQAESIQQIQFDENNGVFSQSITKTLRAHFGPKTIPCLSLSKAIDQFQNSLEQFSLFIPCPNKITQIHNCLEILRKKPLNIWAKAYINVSMFKTENKLFCSVDTEYSVINEILQWVGLRENVMGDKFHKLVGACVPIISQSLYRMLGRPTRWFWECSKVYDDFNLLLHIANEVDASIIPRKEIPIASYFSNYIISLMMRQLIVGFQIQLYQHSEYPYVFFKLQQILLMTDRNYRNYLRGFDKIYSACFEEGTLTHKRKKKVSALTRMIYSDAQFKKGLHHYVQAMLTLLILRQPKSTINQLHINNRFRIFKKVLFFQSSPYQQYIQIYDKIMNNQQRALDSCLESLKEAKRILQLFSQLDANDCLFQQREDAENLVKISVRCSLVCMSLKMKQNKAYYIVNNHPKFPELYFK